MTAAGWLQIALFGAIVIAITRPFDWYMNRVFAGERTLLSPLLRPVERAIYGCCGARIRQIPREEAETAIACLFDWGFAARIVEDKPPGDPPSAGDTRRAA